jgi:hypothetical protein
VETSVLTVDPSRPVRQYPNIPGQSGVAPIYSQQIRLRKTLSSCRVRLPRNLLCSCRSGVSQSSNFDSLPTGKYERQLEPRGIQITRETRRFRSNESTSHGIFFIYPFQIPDSLVRLPIELVRYFLGVTDRMPRQRLAATSANSNAAHRFEIKVFPIGELSNWVRRQQQVKYDGIDGAMRLATLFSQCSIIYRERHKTSTASFYSCSRAGGVRRVSPRTALFTFIGGTINRVLLLRLVKSDET